MKTNNSLASLDPANLLSIDLDSIFSYSNLEQTIKHYESIIAQEDDCSDNYWYLGLAYLLQERELDAQATWFIPFAEASDLESVVLTNQLANLLVRAACQEFVINDINFSWLIRQSLWLIAPNQVDNILHLIIIAEKLGVLTAELSIEYQIDELLGTISVGEIDDSLLKQTIFAVLQRIQNDLGLRVIKSCLLLIGGSCDNIIADILVKIFELSYSSNPGLFSIELVKICQSFSPENLNIYQVLAILYSDAGFHVQAIASAEKYYQVASSQIDKLFGSYLIQRSSFAAGNWQNGIEGINRHCQSLQNIIENFTLDLEKQQVQHLITSSVFLPYAEDYPRKYRSIQNRIASIYQDNIKYIVNSNIFKLDLNNTSISKKTGVLRVGYLASTLREHSVGWLSRWLFQYHDRQSFQIFNYCVNQNSQDPFNHRWFRDRVDVSYYFDNNHAQIAAQIKNDNIDILIDLDSLTNDISCLVMAYKPAPVQVTWLGWDASGSPSVDYFIADPYVLPDNAQDYYQEKIWRLPQTYLGVEGFEVGIPTLRREDLDIPADAIVYFSSQTGYKRHPDCIKSQMEIIKAVPNSYFLIKGKSDPETIQNFFGKLATEVGISLDRLRFLEQVTDEPTHRANLAIADIVLDTFPYNGATTTLETLWMGIPMVTQVGQQFAARNSYTFMLNAGIEEGIAWSQEEYIEWGIKLGLDRNLRDKIAGKLRSGRTTAPVWNAKQFTLDMEAAYRQMWAIYQEQNQDKLDEIDRYSNN
jgi:predicted O-linked N-acetylglucosamine transferase (SPINDLY family)